MKDVPASEPQPRPTTTGQRSASGVWIDRLELGLIVIFSVIAFGLHLLLASHAGGLWRDEAEVVAMVDLPTLGALWDHVPYHSFPALWFLLLRALSGIGFGSDASWRVLGCIVGVATLAVLWRNARLTGGRFPWLTIPLVGFNAVIVRWGDSMRAYGFGLLLVLLLWGTVWEYIQTARRWSLFIVLIVAVLAAHCVYYNSVFVFAILSAGSMVCFRGGDRRKAVSLLGAGLVAGLTLLPYLTVVEKSRALFITLVVEGSDMAYILEKFVKSLRSGGGETCDIIWFGLFSAALVIVLTRQVSAQLSLARKQILLFSVLILCIGFGGFCVFLKILKYHTNDWYYLILMGVMAASLEPILSDAMQSTRGRMVRLLIGLVIIGVFLPNTFANLKLRATTMDIVAGDLVRNADPNDYVIVAPWYLGVSFNRYYHGPAVWETIPPMEDHSNHRYDLLTDIISVNDQPAVMQPILERMTRALQSGHRVWLVGPFELAGPNAPTINFPTLPPPAPVPPFGWDPRVHISYWMVQATKLIQDHARIIEQVPISPHNKAIPFEDPTLQVVSGWQDGTRDLPKP